VILFKPDMVPLILAGKKTVTRRRGKRRWNIGAIHAAYTRPPFAKGGAQPFARVRIVSVDQEDWVGDPWPRDGESWIDLDKRIGDKMLYREHEARREGFADWSEFCRTYEEINGQGSLRNFCWRVAFVLEAGE